MQRKSYSTDPAGSQWHQIKTFFDTQRHHQHDLRRDILDGTSYVVKTGCQWRMLPGEFASWQSVYYYFRRWRRQGLVGCLLSAVRRKAREEADREPEPSALVTDCQSAPITRTGGC
jgi:putative transposase